MIGNIVDPNRIFRLNNSEPSASESATSGPVIYWMSREHRIDDNWALLYAFEQAHGLKAVEIVFSVTHGFPACSGRGFDFMLDGLRETVERAFELGIDFRLLAGGRPASAVSEYASSVDASAIICDFNPLREGLKENLRLAESVSMPVYEVDNRNIIPCRYISDKQEYSAFTLRKKIARVLPAFLTPFPDVSKIVETYGSNSCLSSAPELDHESAPEPGREAGRYKACDVKTDWSEIAGKYRPQDETTRVENLVPGRIRGMKILEDFITERLSGYDNLRNDPNENGQSGLSAYLHFGQISAQYAALSAANVFGDAPLKGGFLDEIIVRRELSDNFVLYNPDYDNHSGFPAWAKHSLTIHQADEREYIYSFDQLKNAKTHDKLWNAAQLQLIHGGLIHGYMRMYWAKKILEWSPNAEAAMRRAVDLNDTYSMDGHDSNGYAGCAWSIGGVHDRAWSERDVFGKIRYMNDRGCRRKFDVDAYIASNQFF